MGLKCGIVGLPNVGKSTLFNALTQTAAAECMNYPFCTIEPNLGVVGVPDRRLNVLSDIASSERIIPTQLEVVDIAGLVRGASNGDGLGNQFLGCIRQTDAILHVVRCFQDDNVTHVNGEVDPIRDIEVIETELMLSDIESLQKKLKNISKKRTSTSDVDIGVVEKILSTLENGKLAITADLNDDERKAARELCLITDKPVLYVCNVNESDVCTGNELTKAVSELAARKCFNSVLVSASIEAEIALVVDPDEKDEFIKSLGLSESGLARVIREGYKLLQLQTFFTVGIKETRAWTVKNGATAAAAAGVIHTDFEKGFICAETISYDDFVKYKGESGAKAAGKMRLEGRDYTVNDGDVFHFRFNV